MVEIRITDVQIEDGGIDTIHFHCDRMELRDVVQEVADNILGMPGMNKAKPIRKEKDNPVIKTNRSDRVYFHYDEPSSRVSLGMADDDVADVVTVILMNMSTTDFWDMVPFDKEMFTQYSRNLIKDFGDKRPRETQGSSQDEVEDAFEDLNKLDESWRGPSQYFDEEAETVEEIEDVGQFAEEGEEETERRVHSGVSISGDKTEFYPPYTKEEASYHGPASGPEPHLDCKDCVHYLEEGGCQVVQGEVDPDGYCEDLFADFGVFGRVDNGSSIINLAVWGEMFEDRFSRVGIEEIADNVKEAIRNKLR